MQTRPRPWLMRRSKSVYNRAGCAIGGHGQDAPQIALNTTLPVGGDSDVEHPPFRSLQ